MKAQQHNLVLLADAYKYSHHKLYYPGTNLIYSYLESRGGEFNETVFFGLQYLLKKYLEGTVITKEKIDEAETQLMQVFGRNDVFDRKRFDYIVEKHHGRLPVRIKAVKEGTAVPVSNVLMTIESTDPECFWLSNFLETLLMQVWYPNTVATVSREIRKIVTRYFKETADESSQGSIDFILNDFGFRGASSVETAALGGAAHLVNFNGSDTIAGSLLAQQYYAAGKMYGMSVPATEHSVCTLLGEEGELEIFKHVLNTFPTGIVACVSDSFDIFRACSDYWGGELREVILNRQGTLVIRPDSGDPVLTLLRVFDILFQKFGYTINQKGCKVLPPQVRVLQGDGINISSIRTIYAAMKVNGIGAENLLLGMGGALLQKVDRDTQKFAFKCSYAEINGEGVDVQKSPLEIDAHGRLVRSFKRSKAGRLKLIKTPEGYATVNQHEHPELPDELVTVFENGTVLNETSFEEVRERAAIEEKAFSI
ncbi:nicotinate phosphoribosyltransferase [Foetidibacter luteolus]|uniref:nicotinate phosphoribosyltransferase n=1 Tax=Foetidibacter luteolus TaxID=2608880 RepID=UPI00129A1D27|nr:nicotinate phosphoribosyltransferase [Foetidibacter luteolus]